MARYTAQANEASEKLAGYLAELQRSAPALTHAFGGAVPTVKELQGWLGAGEALVSFVPVQERTLALLVTRTSVEQRMLSLSPQDTRALVKRIRDSVTFDEAVKVPAFDVQAARQLHEQLFGWAGKSLGGVRSLTVVASGPLGSIPFGLLVGPQQAGQGGQDYRSLPWLVRSMAVAHVPSIASWQALTAGSAPVRSGTFVAWADPDFGGAASGTAAAARGVRQTVRSVGRDTDAAAGALPANLGAMLPVLPETRAEAQAIAKALKASPQSDVLTGAKATRASVLALSASGALAQKGVVMFATHGLVPAEVPGLYQPALALAREPGATLPSLLQLEDVIGLRMNAGWVLLSACNTSAADRPGGDPLSGLARGFFFAGARSLLVTHWAVESESAAELTVRTMQNYAVNARLTRAQALQQTALEFIAAKNTPADWAHPAYWAPYALVGDGRR